MNYETEIEEIEESPTEAQLTAEEFYRQSEPTPVNELRESALRRLDTLWFKALRMGLNYEGNQPMAWDCLALALGQGEMIQLPQSINPKCKPVNAVMVAKKHLGGIDPSSGKATVTKCVKRWQDSLDIPPMPGQRSEQGRKSMEESRNEQVKK